MSTQGYTIPPWYLLLQALVKVCIHTMWFVDPQGKPFRKEKDNMNLIPFSPPINCLTTYLPSQILATMPAVAKEFR